jgi:hypothetical protein
MNSLANCLNGTGRDIEGVIMGQEKFTQQLSDAMVRMFLLLAPSTLSNLKVHLPSLNGV